MNKLADPIVFFPHFHKMADIRHQILPEWRTFLIPFFLFFIIIYIRKQAFAWIKENVSLRSKATKICLKS